MQSTQHCSINLLHVCRRTARSDFSCDVIHMSTLFWMGRGPRFTFLLFQHKSEQTIIAFLLHKHPVCMVPFTWLGFKIRRIVRQVNSLPVCKDLYSCFVRLCYRSLKFTYQLFPELSSFPRPLQRGSFKSWKYMGGSVSRFFLTSHTKSCSRCLTRSPSRLGAVLRPAEAAVVWEAVISTTTALMDASLRDACWKW